MGLLESWETFQFVQFVYERPFNLRICFPTRNGLELPLPDEVSAHCPLPVMFLEAAPPYLSRGIMHTSFLDVSAEPKPRFATDKLQNEDEKRDMDNNQRESRLL